MEYLELQGIFFLRMLLACACGIVLGIERQHRTKSAGVRTHLMIAIASALMMLVSKYGFLDIVGTQEGVSVDISRVAAGIITGIGIFGGVIYIGKMGTASGVTTIAGVWVTVGIGMACGAGMYLLSIGTTAIVLIFQYALHNDLWIVRQNTRLKVALRLENGWEEFQKINEDLSLRHIELRQVKWERKDDKVLELKCLAAITDKTDKEEAVKALLDTREVAMVEIL